MRSLWLAVFAWIGVIFFSSTTTASRWCEAGFSYLSQIFMSNLPRDSGSFGMIHLAADKGLHITLFTVLAILLSRAMMSPKNKGFRILAFGFAVGCCSEYLQSFFPDRDPAIRDVFINLAGTGLGVLIGRTVWRSRTFEGREELREYTFSRPDGQ